MSRLILYMAMSLDGFITGPNEGPDNGLGDGGERLHEWVFEGSGNHPKESVGRRREFLADLLIGHDHEIAVHDLICQWQGCMRRTGVGRAPVEYAQGFGFTHVRDIDDGEAAEPITYI